jgi:hypothetical protein
MESDQYRICAGCNSTLGPGDPFCLTCGTLSPSLVNTGDLAIEVQDVPGQRLRAEVVSILKAWFPEMDTIRADERFQSGWHILVRGIDEKSGSRILAALKRIKIDGRLLREDTASSWKEKLLNPGLIVAAVGAFLCVIIGGITAMALAPVPLAAPFVWAFLKSRRQEALLVLEDPSPRYEKWSRLAEEYAQVVRLLDLQDRQVLRTLAGTAFDLQHRLSSDSLVAVAAGEDRGELYSRLTDAVRTALSLGTRISSLADGEERTSLQRELLDLTEMVLNSATWFRSMEQGPVKEPAVLHDELHGITRRIDRILSQVRSPRETESPRFKTVRS